MRIVAVGGGVILTLLGVITLFTPIPIGIILIACGLSLVICFSARAKEALRKLRTNNRRIHDYLLLLEEKVEVRLRKLHVELIKTRPHSDNDQDSPS